MRRAPAPRKGRSPWWWTRTIGPLVLLCLGAVWYLWGERGPDLSRVANLTAPGETVVFFGDSITQGYGVRPEESFPSLVSGELGLTFVNAGVPGDTMAAGFARMARDLLPHRPRLVLVEFGGNDFLRRVPVEETLKSLDAIVNTLVTQGSLVVILEVNVGLVSDPHLKGFRAVAERHGAVLIPNVMRGILGDPDLKVDTIHPNARGHRLIAARVVKVLRSLLREADRRRGPTRAAAWQFRLPAFVAVG